MNLIGSGVYSMNKIIGVTDLQRRFKSVLDDVGKRGIPYILTRGSRPEAALVPYDEYQRFQEFQESEILNRFDRLVDRMAVQNARFSEEEVEADIRVAREQA
jgi:prevent-host-death family protein